MLRFVMLKMADGNSVSWLFDRSLESDNNTNDVRRVLKIVNTKK